MRLCKVALLFALTAVVSFSSCELETSGNGDLDGMWHLRRVDTLATTAASASCDMSDESIYWLVEADLIVLDDKSDANEDIIMLFELTDDSLRLYSPYIYDREDGDREIESVEQLKPYGVSATDVTFGINSLSGGKMVLESTELRLTFKKR